MRSLKSNRDSNEKLMSWCGEMPWEPSWQSLRSGHSRSQRLRSFCSTPRITNLSKNPERATSDWPTKKVFITWKLLCKQKTPSTLRFHFDRSVVYTPVGCDLRVCLVRPRPHWCAKVAGEFFFFFFFLSRLRINFSANSTIRLCLL